MSQHAPTFQFGVEEVFYIKSIDRVILVGTVKGGTVRPGDKATVHCRCGPIAVVVEGIETIKEGAVQLASTGQQVGLRLQGISKDQPLKGDVIIGEARE